MSIGCGKGAEKLHFLHAFLLRRFACRPAAFLAVRRGQSEGEPSLVNFKLHTARVRVCIGLAELIKVSYGVGSFWYCSVKIKAPIRPYNGQNQGIIFVSDPQLRGSTKCSGAGAVVWWNGRHDRHTENSSCSENLFRQGKMSMCSIRSI